MKILLFGISCVGKTSVGKILAQNLGYSFYDLDEEIKKATEMSLEEFVNTRDLEWRDGKRCKIIQNILDNKETLVLAVSPLSHPESIRDRIHQKDILSIQLYDKVENIYDRLVFSDKNDNIYTDDAYKEAHKVYYLKDIEKDLRWYGFVYSLLGIKNNVFINNDPPKKVAQKIIKDYQLK